MAYRISVQFKENGKAYYFDAGEIQVHAGDGVIVETVRGQEYGTVATEPRPLAESELNQYKKLVRMATEDDVRKVQENRKKARSAFDICEKKIAEHKLEMKLVDVEVAFDGSKMLFCFTADGRVDFRELVKDLASVFRTRIELRQIGVRDETKMLGGLGPCGRECCCSSFLSDFHPVSIKMAKEQGLSLNPTKISGLCGRLMCCLKYEQEAYEYARKHMPRNGSEVRTPDGAGVVIDVMPIKGALKVKMTTADNTIDVREYKSEDLRVIKHATARDEEEAADSDE